MSIREELPADEYVFKRNWHISCPQTLPSLQPTGLDHRVERSEAIAVFLIPVVEEGRVAML